jgi:hypothetical protein
MTCGLCRKVVLIDDYADHVMAEHSAPSSQMAQQPGGPAQSQRITTPIKAEDYAGGEFLKGSDVPEDLNTVSFQVLAFVNKKGSQSKLTAEIAETYGRTIFGLNTSNIRILAAMGYHDLQTLCGKTVTCVVCMQPNPQAMGTLVRSLLVSKVE